MNLFFAWSSVPIFEIIFPITINIFNEWMDYLIVMWHDQREANCVLCLRVSVLK